MMPSQLQIALLGSGKHIGFTADFLRPLLLKKIIKSSKNGKVKTIHKQQALTLGFSYYYQPGLHQRYSVLAGYQLQRVGRKGMYSAFTPQLGISRTFIAEETYVVDETGGVKQKKGAGNWNLLAGASVGIGKEIAPSPNAKLPVNRVFLNSVLWVAYPNFRFIALKPSLQLGVSILLRAKQYSVKKNCIQRKPK
jgi:hypothetical protein